MEARYSAGRPYCWWLVASHVLHPKQLQSHYRWRFDWVPTWPIGFVCRRQISQRWSWASSSGLRAELDIHTLDAECRPSKIAPPRFASPAQIADLRRGLIRKGTDRPVCKSTFDIVMKPCEVHFSRARLVPRLQRNRYSMPSWLESTTSTLLPCLLFFPRSTKPSRRCRIAPRLNTKSR
jgi:hypothetical protein